MSTYPLKKKPLVIGICGMYRSGTTWQYNAVRILMETAGHTVSGGGWDTQYPVEDIDADVVIIKEHRWRPKLAELADVIFTSDRARDEVLASMERFRGERPTAQEYEKWRMALNAYKKHSSYHMAFEDMTRNNMYRLSILCDMAAEIVVHYKGENPFLQPDCDFVDILKKVDSLEPPTDVRHDPVTLLFRNHITNPDPQVEEGW